MSKAYSRFLTELFCLFLGGLLVWHVLLPDRDRSEVENRTLTQLPEFSWESLKDGSYTAAVEEYFADQFPLRDEWTGLKARTEQLLGKTLFNGVFLCGDTLISQVPAPENGQMEKNLSYIQRLPEKVSVPVYLGIIPSAAEVWKDKLPAGAQSWDQTQLLEAAEETGLPTIDFHTPLTLHAQEPIFYRTDHHWTTLGAFYGANALLESLGMEPLNQEDYTPQVVSESFNGTLYSTSGIHWLTPDTIEYWVPEDGLTVTSWRTGEAAPGMLYDRSYLEHKDQYSSFLGGNQPLCVIENENLPDGDRILLVRDSYSDALAPFLAQRFSQVHLVDLRYYRMPLAQYVAENDIDAVCVVYSAQNFLTDRDLVMLTQ